MKRIPDVIIVDDDPNITELILGMLDNYDLEIACYNNSLEGLEVIVQQKPRIVFLDLNMPELQGDRFMVKLSEKYIFQTTSIFLVTGQQLTDEAKMKLLTLGIEQIIYKPFSEEDIYNAVASIMGVVPNRIKAA